MTVKRTKRRFRLAMVLCMVAIAVLILNGCKRQPSEEPTNPTSPQPAEANERTSEASPEIPDLFPAPKINLEDVIRSAESWMPKFVEWTGKPAPDFVAVDLDGKEHSLSDYRGKDVIVVFWGTWCAPCRAEVPDLIELRRSTGRDKLAILAISNEPIALIKQFVTRNNINYTVLSSPSVLPQPYNQIQYIPSSFFIDSRGRIKIGTQGALTLDAMKSILKAG